MRSPRSGAECRLLQKGETANPGGCSVKVRARKALEKILDDPVLERAFKRLAGIAADKDHKDADAVQALRLVADVTGLRVPESEQHTVKIEIGFRQRSSGDAAELEVTPKETTGGEGVEL